MSSLSIVSIGAALAMLASSAFADPLGRGSKARKASLPSVSDSTTNNGYYAPYVVGVDGKKHPIMEIPGSVTVISRQLMDDQQATTLGDALRNVSGVTVRGR